MKLVLRHDLDIASGETEEQKTEGSHLVGVQEEWTLELGFDCPSTQPCPLEGSQSAAPSKEV